jgi:hypothetical protein
MILPPRIGSMRSKTMFVNEHDLLWSGRQLLNDSLKLPDPFTDFQPLGDITR